MSELVANCPRCKAKEMTFDIISDIYLYTQHGWQKWYEAFSICRNCKRSTVFVLAQIDLEADRVLGRDSSISNLNRSVNIIMDIKGHISHKDEASEPPPEYLPENIESAFREGAACISIGCHNAGATMFRLCIDIATKSMLPEEDVHGLNQKVRRSLGFRLKWLFDNNYLQDGLRELSNCIKG